MREPLIHSHITDVLPETHKLANEEVYCASCRGMLHFVNNECMQTWVETGEGNFCINCFMLLGVHERFCDHPHDILEPKFGLSERRGNE